MLHRQKQVLRDEILKSLTGEARFDVDLLQSLLDDNQEAIKVSEGIIAYYQREKEQEETRLQYLSTQIQSIRDWAKVFDDAETDEKRMILSKIIERIEVDHNYDLTIHFYVTMEDFQPTEEYGESFRCAGR